MATNQTASDERLWAHLVSFQKVLSKNLEEQAADFCPLLKNPLPLALAKSENPTIDPYWFPWEGDSLQLLKTECDKSVQNAKVNDQDCYPIYLLKTSGCGKTKLAISLQKFDDLIVFPIRLAFRSNTDTVCSSIN
jgi:hypothetical protein